MFGIKKKRNEAVNETFTYLFYAFPHWHECSFPHWEAHTVGVSMAKITLILISSDFKTHFRIKTSDKKRCFDFSEIILELKKKRVKCTVRYKLQIRTWECQTIKYVNTSAKITLSVVNISERQNIVLQIFQKKDN